MSKRITILPGDGIGPEVINEAEALLKDVSEQYAFPMDITHALIGGTWLHT